MGLSHLAISELVLCFEIVEYCSICFMWDDDMGCFAWGFMVHIEWMHGLAGYGYEIMIDGLRGEFAVGLYYIYCVVLCC